MYYIVTSSKNAPGIPVFEKNDIVSLLIKNLFFSTSAIENSSRYTSLSCTGKLVISNNEQTLVLNGPRYILGSFFLGQIVLYLSNWPYCYY